MADSLDLSGLQDYVRQNTSEIYSMAYYGIGPDLSKLEMRTNVKNGETLDTLEIDDIVQPYSDDFTPQNNKLRLIPRTIYTKKAKTDLKFVPLSYHNKWLAERQRPGRNQDDMPFQEFFAMKIAERIGNLLMRNTVWNGVLAVTPTDSTNFVDGFAKIIADEITAGNITPVATGVITQSNAVEKFEQMYDSSDVDLQNADGSIFCSPQDYMFYCRDYRARYKVSPADEFNQVKIEGTDTTIEPLRSATGSRRLLHTLPSNVVVGTDLESDFSEIHIERRHRTLEMSMDYSLGLQFNYVDDRVMNVNDQS